MKNLAYKKLWAILTPAQRFEAMFLLAGNLGAAVLEVLGLISFGQVLSLLTLGPHSANSRGMTWLIRMDLQQMALICGAVYFIKNGLMLSLAWLEARLAFGVQTHLSVKTLDSLLRQDYEIAAQQGQSATLNLMTAGMSTLAFNVLLPGLTLLAEGSLMLALVLFLILTQPMFVTGMLLILSLVTGALLLVSRKMVVRIGRARHRAEDARMQMLTGIFDHLREMYVYAAGPRAALHLQGALKQLATANRDFQLLSGAPRFVLEVTLVGVLLVVVYLRAPGGLDASLVVSIGVFGVAGFRLLLGINRMVGSLQAMRFSDSMVDRIAHVLAHPTKLMPNGRGDSQMPTGALQLTGIDYAYAGKGPVLRGVDFVLSRHSMIAIKGRSGAGKSTLLEIMAGLRTAATGVMELDGRPVLHKHQLLGRVAYAGQQPAVFPDTIRANVAFGLPPESIRDDAVWRALARVHLDEMVRDLPGQLNFHLGDTPPLSGGQTQRLALARALYIEADYLLLDEPTAALDAETERQLLVTFRELTTIAGVVIVSHRTAPLEAADQVLELLDGRLVPSEATRVEGV